MDLVLDGHMVGEVKYAIRDEHLTSPRIGIGGFKRGTVVGDAIPHSAVIAHIDKADHVADVDVGDVLDHDVIDADHAARAVHDVDAKVTVDRVRPDHIDATTRTRADNRADLGHLAIGA